MPRAPLPAALLTGAGFGALNAVLVDLAADPAARFGGYLLNAGWAWAGLAVAAGAAVRRPLPGALTGWLTASLALFAFDAVAALLDDVPLAATVRADLSWWLVGLVFCPFLGYVGSQVWRPDRFGLLARLVVPLGAALEMLVRPPGGGLHREALWAQVVVWTVAASSSLVLLRHRRGPDRQPGRA